MQTRGLPQQTSGLKDPKVDYFTDVARALHAYLLRTDKGYKAASDSARDRNARRVAGKRESDL